MKKLFVLIIVIVWTGCGFSFKSDYFSKKNECATYIEQLKKEIEQKNSNSLWTQWELVKVFYSPSKNSCLHILYFSMKNSFTRGENAGFTIYDTLTLEILDSYPFCVLPANVNTESLAACQGEYKQVHKEYQSNVSELEKVNSP